MLLGRHHSFILEDFLFWWVLCWLNLSITLWGVPKGIKTNDGFGEGVIWGDQGGYMLYPVIGEHVQIIFLSFAVPHQYPSHQWMKKVFPECAFSNFLLLPSLFSFDHFPPLDTDIWGHWPLSMSFGYSPI